MCPKKNTAQSSVFPGFEAERAEHTCWRRMELTITFSVTWTAVQHLDAQVRGSRAVVFVVNELPTTKEWRIRHQVTGRMVISTSSSCVCRRWFKEPNGSLFILHQKISAGGWPVWDNWSFLRCFLHPQFHLLWQRPPPTASEKTLLLLLIQG